MVSEPSLLNTIFDATCLALSLIFVLLLLWHDRQKRSIQSLAIFIGLLVAWNAGLMILRALRAVGYEADELVLATALVDGGTAASNVAFYAFITAQTGGRATRLIQVAGLAIGMIIVLRVTLSGWVAETDMMGQLRLEGMSSAFFLLYTGVGLYTLFEQRRKVDSRLIHIGSVLFAGGQCLALLNTRVGISTLSTNAVTLGALLLVLSLITSEIIIPLAARARQVETLHRVNQRIIGESRLVLVLEEIAKQAAEWVGGDAGGVFLRQDNALVFVAGYNMPPDYLGTRLDDETGVIGLAAKTRRSQHLENYRAEWQGAPDFPHAPVAFASVIAIPVSSPEAVYGVVFAVTGHSGRTLRSDDVYRLELLAPQVALAVSYTNFLDLKTDSAQAIEENRQQLETVLISTESPVLAVDRAMRLVFANPAARSVLGLTGVERGEIIASRLPLDVVSRDLRGLASGLRSGYGLIEVTLNDRIYQCHLARMGRAKRAGWVAVLNDVTQLKELDRLKGEMLRMVSHDLKNPLMSAMLQIDSIRHESGDAPNDAIDNIEHQLERMERIIRGVLDVERLRHGALRLYPSPLAPVVQSAVRDLQRLASDAQIRLDVQVGDDLNIWCDEDHAERAISNLIENAIKFTPKGGEVTLRAAQQDEHVMLIVRDTGVGIPEGIQSQIFQRFFRGRQRGFEHVTGTGLGLALVRAIMDNHQGAVWFESRDGEGTTFFLRFRRAEPDDIVL
jgi:signal transduction histidine kinase